MIDIHCHILPGVDDGPGSLNEALDMCRSAVADGIKTIVATPHFNPGTFEFTGRKVSDTVDILVAAAKDEGMDLRILPGAEVAVSPEMPAHLKQNRHLTLNSSGRYFLAELPPFSVPPAWDAFLLSILSSGLVPIIAHPERNPWFINHPDALSFAVDNGIMVQITAMSITGGLGPEPRDFSAFLLRNNLVHVIATDAHSADFRSPVLSEAAAIAADLIGVESAEALVKSVPEAIIAGRDIPTLRHARRSSRAVGRKGDWFRRLFR